VLKARGGGLGAHEQSPVLHLDFMSRHRVVFESWFSEPGEPMESPIVPRAYDVITVQASLAERSGHVITDAGNGTKPAISMRDCQVDPAQGHFGERMSGEFCRRANIYPFKISHGVRALILTAARPPVNGAVCFRGLPAENVSECNRNARRCPGCIHVLRD